MNYNNITDVALTHQDGLENASGIKEKVYFIPKSYFAPGGIAAPNPAATTAEGLVIIPGDHILEEGKAPIELIPFYDKSGLNGTGAGEVQSGVFTSRLELFLPQLSAKNAGSAGAIKNMRGILLFQRIFNSAGDWLQIGSEDLWATPTPDGTYSTGVGPTGEPGIRVNFQAHGYMPVYFYQGEFPAPIEE